MLGVATIALHVLDDSFLQPPPGTSADDHLVSGLVPLAVLALAAWTYPRVRGGRRGAMALVFGAFGSVAGTEAVHYTAKVGASGDHYTGPEYFKAAGEPKTLWVIRSQGTSVDSRRVRPSTGGA